MSEELTPMDRMELWMSALNEAITNGTDNSFMPYNRYELWMKKLCEAILAKDPADPDVVQQFVEDWLDEHPEATTTVEDGAVTLAKLADAVKSHFALADDVDELKNHLIEDANGTYEVGDMIPDTYIKANGSPAAYTGWYATDFVRVPMGSNLVIFASASSGGAYNAFYTESKSKLGNNFSFVSGLNYIAIPNTAKYFRLSMPNTVAFSVTTKAQGEIDKLTQDVPTYRGLLQNLSITALTSCIDNGWYSTGGAYASNITDLPSDFTAQTAFNLYVNYPSYASDIFITQTLKDINGNAWIRCLSKSGNTWSVYKDWVKCGADISSLETDISDLEADVVILKDGVYENVLKTNYVLNGGWPNGKYWNIETAVAVLTDLAQSAWMASSEITVAEGETYTVSACQGATHKARIWTLTDDDLNIVATAQDHYTTNSTVATETFIVPQNATKLLITTRSDIDAPYAYVYKKQSAFDLIKEDEKPLKGRKLSLLGDSISAYVGTIPSGYDAYYTGSNSGVDSPSQMWWSVLCDELGMIPLVINGYSGSAVTQLEDSAHISKIPMSSDERCSGLDDGTTDPDIIIIAGGVNDYSYAQSAQSEPLAWDGLTAPTLSDSFTEAYACMIKKLQTNYPNAVVVCLSTWFTMRGDDNGYTLTHSVGSNKYTQTDYNNAIKYVAEQMHVPFIDVSNIGFNRENFYPTYAQDSSTIPTHPNKVGQGVMGRAIAKKLPELVKAFLI